MGMSHGDGIGYVDGNGYGDGYGDGFGFGFGNGDGDGDGDGNGYNYGDGFGNSNSGAYAEVDIQDAFEAWHFVPVDGYLRYTHNGTRPCVEVGLVLECNPDRLKLCIYGLHASLAIKEARGYCDGILTRVKCSGRVIFGEDKLVCSRREVVAVYPAGVPQ